MTEHLQWLLLCLWIALWIKLNFSCAFCEIFKNIIDRVAVSLCHEIQNIKIHYGSYMQSAQWDSKFLPITEAYLEPSRKSMMRLFCKNSQYASVLHSCQSTSTIYKVFFSVQHSDNSKIVTVLYHHNRSTI